MKLVKSVILKPHQMTQKYKKHIHDNLSKNIVDTCTEDQGYIFGISKIINMVEVNSNENIIFKVTCEIDSFLPKKGDVHEATVCWCFDGGVLAIIKGVHKTLIPVKTFQDDYVFQDNKYIHRTNESSNITTGTTLKICLDGVKFISPDFKSFSKIAMGQ